MAKKEKDDGKTRESGRRSGPFVLSITLPASDYRSDTFRVTPATPPRPSPDYSLEDGIAAASSTSSSSLCPPREDGLPSERPSDRSKQNSAEGGDGGARTCAFEVRSTRLTGVDQISEGEIIQGRRRDRDKAPVTAHRLLLFFSRRFFSCLSTSSRLVPSRNFGAVFDHGIPSNVCFEIL